MVSRYGFERRRWNYPSISLKEPIKITVISMAGCLFEVKTRSHQNTGVESYRWRDVLGSSWQKVTNQSTSIGWTNTDKDFTYRYMVTRVNKQLHITSTSVYNKIQSDATIFSLPVCGYNISNQTGPPQVRVFSDASRKREINARYVCTLWYND
jgi:hypothetical protein